MQRLLEYITNHPLIVAATVAMALAVLGFEAWRARTGGAAIGPSDAVRLLNQGALLLDVRSREQFDAGHVIDARNLHGDELANAAETFKRYKDKVVVACCETGTSSGAAVRSLRAQGFTKAVNLRGGLQAWRAESLPLVKADAKSKSK